MSDLDSARSGAFAGMAAGGMGAVAFGGLAIFGAVAVLVDLISGISTPAMIVGPILIVSGLLGALIFGWMSITSVGQWRRWGALVKDATPALATFGGSSPTRTKLNRSRLHRIALTVTPASGAPYSVTSEWFFPPDLRDVLTPGAQVVVRVASTDPRIVIVDWDRTREAWAGVRPG